MGRTRPWTMDFLHDALATGRKLRTLSIEDAYPRRNAGYRGGHFATCPTRGPGARKAAPAMRPLPRRIVVDHGMEFTSTTHGRFMPVPSITTRENVALALFCCTKSLLRHAWKLSLVPPKGLVMETVRLRPGNSRPRILIADDHTVIFALRLLRLPGKEICRRWGRSRRSGPCCRKPLRLRPDVIVADVAMPCPLETVWTRPEN